MKPHVLAPKYTSPPTSSSKCVLEYVCIDSIRKFGISPSRGWKYMVGCMTNPKPFCERSSFVATNTAGPPPRPTATFSLDRRKRWNPSGGCSSRLIPAQQVAFCFFMLPQRPRALVHFWTGTVQEFALAVGSLFPKFDSMSCSLVKD